MSLLDVSAAASQPADMQPARCLAAVASEPAASLSDEDFSQMPTLPNAEPLYSTFGVHP